MSVKMWAIQDFNGRLVSVHASRYRTLAIKYWTGVENHSTHWRFWKRRGYRCVRVTVTVEAP